MMAELSLVVKATFILATALLATWLIRRTAASSTRALILTAACGGLLVLPLMELVLPSRTVEIQVPRMSSGVDAFVPALTAGSRLTPVINHARGQGAAPLLPQPFPSGTILRVGWAIGALILLIRLGIGLRRLRTLHETGEPWGDPTAAAMLQQATSRRVHLFLHSGLNGPMTCGIVRPAIGLPFDARDWSAAELRQALIHEVEHIRRADWLVQVAARVACDLYWFHPLVWMAARRLHLECEYACDDAVVRVSARASYAQQLVSMARRLSEGVSRPALSMADRRDLAKRVDAVLNDKRPRTQLRTMTVAAAAITALVVTATIAPWHPITAQTGGVVEDVLPIPTALTGKAFDQISIQPGDATGSTTQSFDVKTGVFVARNTTVLGLISHAYAAVPQLDFVPGEPYEVHDTRITGGPEWIRTDTFNITASVKPPVTAEDMSAMLRRLLRDSFDLAVRVETQQTPAYRMVRVATAGSSAPGLQPGNQDCANGSSAPDIFLTNTDGTNPRRLTMEGEGPGRIVRHCTTLAAFAASFTLTEVLGRPVVDRTGMTGVFNVSLVHAPTRDELSTIYKLSPSDLPREFFERPSIFAAMAQQLGLRLESTRGVVHTLAIDSAERPQIR